ncbi:MAG: histidinol-phosphatase HisJ family protein [Faecalibacterium sp.]|jgi:histidinol-phosphatase (PHP family)|nr:histidinol-phosphatase HisJ family protein [Faecalibacterium sp.]
MADYRKSSPHCHSTLCDGKNTLQEMASAACAQGLETLGFTGHSHTPCDLEYCMTPSRTGLYQATITKLKTEYRGKVDILCGLEWDQFSDENPAAYDYWIGSVHYLRGPKTGKYYEIDWRPQDLKDCIDHDFGGDGLAMAQAYFRSVAEVAAKKPDILGHFDLIKKLNCTGAYFDENSPRYKAAAEAALAIANENECLLEINTGGVYRGFRNDFYPSFWILEAWQKLGGKVIITADAHTTDSLTFGYEDAAQLAKSAGFSEVQVLTAEGFVPCAI